MMSPMFLYRDSGDVNLLHTAASLAQRGVEGRILSRAKLGTTSATIYS